MSAKEKLAFLDVNALVALRRNPQYCTPAQMDSLKRSIQRDGFVSPVLVRPIKGGKYEIVSGNHRVLAARELQMAQVPCVIMKMTERASKRLAMNLNTIHGNPNPELVAPFLAELDEMTLAEIHLEDSMIAEILKFDDELAAKLAALEPVSSEDRGSSMNLPTCICPTCGRRHQPKE